MKKNLFAVSLLVLFISCSDATDGDASTDTTTMTIDTAVQNSAMTDTANHVNRNTGVYPRDTVLGKKNDVRSSTGTDQGSRTSTPGNKGQNKKAGQ
jgi:hypothetical protein